jgi:hypothetical protein
MNEADESDLLMTALVLLVCVGLVVEAVMVASGYESVWWLWWLRKS